jgi:2'-deoxynucleoside 5'-phosphate N-hydrolase
MAHIYFAGSISGGREDVEIYNQIVDALRALGHEVNAGQVTNRDLPPDGEAGEAQYIYDRDVAWLDAVAARKGLLVAEVSRPSIGVGYEIGYARHNRRIPVICLWRPGHSGRCSAMVEGDPAVTVLKYDEADLAGLISRLHQKIVELSE